MRPFHKVFILVFVGVCVLKTAHLPQTDFDAIAVICKF